jgi:hypothetical protein
MKAFKRVLILAALSQWACCGAFATTSDSDRDAWVEFVEKKTQIEVEAAIVRTRQDLQTWVRFGAKSNPFNKLSPAAKIRLIEKSTYDAKGLITSTYTADIEQELSPSEAYKLLTLLGAQSIAAHTNNGQIKSALDRSILEAIHEGVMSPVSKGAYCNGGYCTANSQMSCYVQTCKPPSKLQ